MAEILSVFIWLLTRFSKQNKVMKSAWNYVFIYFLFFSCLESWWMHSESSEQAPDHWTVHHAGTADKSHIKSNNNNSSRMCDFIINKAKWKGTASMLMSSKAILRDVLMIMKWHRNEKQTAPFHPDGLTGAVTEAPGAGWPGSKWHVGWEPVLKWLSFQHQPLKHFASGLLSFPMKKVSCLASMNIKSWQLLKDLSLKRRDFLHPAAETWRVVLWVDVCQGARHVQCL